MSHQTQDLQTSDPNSYLEYRVRYSLLLNSP